MNDANLARFISVAKDYSLVPVIPVPIESLAPDVNTNPRVPPSRTLSAGDSASRAGKSRSPPSALKRGNS